MAEESVLVEWKENALLLFKNPGEVLEKAKTMNLSRALTLAVISYAIAGLLAGLPNGVLGIIMGMTQAILGTLMLVVSGVILNLLLKLGGGKGKIESTINVLALISPLVVLVGFVDMVFGLVDMVMVATQTPIPALPGPLGIVQLTILGVLNFIIKTAIEIWMLYLQIRGFSIVHEMSMARAFVFAFLIPFLVVLAVSLMFVAYIVSMLHAALPM